MLAERSWYDFLVGAPPGKSDVVYKDHEVVVPAFPHHWVYTDGRDAVPLGDDFVAASIEMHQAIAQDLAAATSLTYLRGRRLAEGWSSLAANGSPVASMSRVAVARTLFETGLEARRVALAWSEHMEVVPNEPATAWTFADGLTIPLFRYLGGEKSGFVGPRETARNTLSNVKYLGRGAATAEVPRIYNLASEYLHGAVALPDERIPEMAGVEAFLLLTGANLTLMAVAAFQHVADTMPGLIARLGSLTEISRIGAVGVDNNIPPVDWGLGREDAN